MNHCTWRTAYPKPDPLRCARYSRNWLDSLHSWPCLALDLHPRHTRLRTHSFFTTPAILTLVEYQIEYDKWLLTVSVTVPVFGISPPNCAARLPGICLFHLPFVLHSQPHIPSFLFLFTLSLFLSVSLFTSGVHCTLHILLSFTLKHPCRPSFIPSVDCATLLCACSLSSFPVFSTTFFGLEIIAYIRYCII